VQCVQRRGPNQQHTTKAREEKVERRPSAVRRTLFLFFAPRKSKIGASGGTSNRPPKSSRRLYARFSVSGSRSSSLWDTSCSVRHGPVENRGKCGRPHSVLTVTANCA
jgi:hypothetical protein